jgi:hypothetical protein
MGCAHVLGIIHPDLSAIANKFQKTTIIYSSDLVHGIATRLYI